MGRDAMHLLVAASRVETQERSGRHLYAPVLPDDLREKPEFTRLVMDALIGNGWRVNHVEDSRLNHSGLPDVIAVRPPRLLLVELKRNGTYLERTQRLWRDDLLGCPGVEYRVVRPRDWRSFLEWIDDGRIVFIEGEVAA